MHYLQRQSTGQRVALDTHKPLAGGGEGRIYPVVSDEGLVAKLYHRPTAAHVAKLRVMLDHPPADPTVAQGHISIAWPIDLLHNDRKQVQGFLMQRVVSKWPLVDVYNTGARLNGAAYQQAVKSCGAVGATVEGNIMARDKAGQTTVTFLRKAFGL